MNISLLENFEKDIKLIERKNKLPFCSRPRRNRNDSMMKMNFEYNKLLFHKTESYQTLKNTDISTTKHSCKTVSLSDLNPILLKDLLVPHVHHGKYLLCRTITYSFTIVGVLTLVEDLNDDVEELALYHFQKSLIDDPNTWLPPGTILIIKEPYLKYASSQGQTVILRCDSPSDVIFVDECNEELLKGTKWYQKCTFSFDQLKVKGNTYYSSEDYGNALKFYDRALKISPDHPVILLNKSAAFLMLERYYEAHQSALKAFQSENPLVNKEKILIRLARSAYGMRNWKLSVDYYSSLLNLDGTNQIVIEEIQQAKQRYEESTSGKYNLYHIMDEYIRSLATQKPLFFDVADYSGPIEITDIVGKGKGLVASADIPKGTLLIGSKAFSLSYNPQDDFILIPRDFLRKLILRKTAYLNITKTIQTLKNNPHRASELYSLYSYSYDRKEIIEDNIIDTGRIEEICLFNSFQPQEILFPFSNLSAETQPKNIIDDKSPTGLWILPSFLNHSCIGNSNRIFYGDFMMVYAIKDLIKGEEITFSYVPVDSYFDRNKAIQSFYKFSCTCSLCNEEKNDKSYSQREKLLQENSQIINLFDKG
jgi:tetratricopeptide (TPR) repeat protein